MLGKSDGNHVVFMISPFLFIEEQHPIVFVEGALPVFLFPQSYGPLRVISYKYQQLAKQLGLRLFEVSEPPRVAVTRIDSSSDLAPK